MEKFVLTAQVREKAGKGVARGLRRNQMVPAVLYSHGKSTPIAMGYKDVTKVLNAEGGEHALSISRSRAARTGRRSWPWSRTTRSIPRAAGSSTSTSWKWR